jgi:hypothetical protein
MIGSLAFDGAAGNASGSLIRNRSLSRSGGNILRSGDAAEAQMMTDWLCRQGRTWEDRARRHPNGGRDAARDDGGHFAWTSRRASPTSPPDGNGRVLFDELALLQVRPELRRDLDLRGAVVSDDLSLAGASRMVSADILLFAKVRTASNPASARSRIRSASWLDSR